jgi:transposase
VHITSVRKLKAFGHDVRLMPANYVRPYSKGQEKDFHDAVAIVKEVQRPTMSAPPRRRRDPRRARPPLNGGTLNSPLRLHHVLVS